ncbi:hypothetical protein N9913_02490 [Porticoccaceae bacterium]|nr:hypothetical protein [Porticoccaceae bacterium]
MTDQIKPQLDELLKKGPDTLAHDVQDIDGLEPSEFKKKQLRLKHDKNRHWSECIAPVLNWVYLGLIVLAFVGLVLMAAFWLVGNHNNFVKIEETFNFVWGVLLTAGSTLAIEAIVKAKR